MKNNKGRLSEFSIQTKDGTKRTLWTTSNSTAADWVWRGVVVGFCLIWLSGILGLGFLVLKYYLVLIAIASQRLHVPRAFLVILFSIQIIQTVRPEIANLPIYKIGPRNYLKISLIGGVIPVALALYQLRYVSLLAVAVVSTVVTVFSYFSAIVLPLRGIQLLTEQVWLIALLAVLVTGLCVEPSAERLDVAVAFASSVIGCVVGCDLLHLKDMKLRQNTNRFNTKMNEFAGSLRPENRAVASLIQDMVRKDLFAPSIGGAGFKDVIPQMGIASLLIAEWFPTVIDFVNARLGAFLHREGLAFGLAGIVVALLVRNTKRSQAVAKVLNETADTNFTEKS